AAAGAVALAPGRSEAAHPARGASRGDVGLPARAESRTGSKRGPLARHTAQMAVDMTGKPLSDRGGNSTKLRELLLGRSTQLEHGHAGIALCDGLLAGRAAPAHGRRLLCALRIERRTPELTKPARSAFTERVCGHGV